MSAPEIVVVGSANVDLVVFSKRFPAPGETLDAKEFRIFAGGKGANQAAAAARMGIPTRLIARVGKDVFAPMLRAELSSAGVDVHAVETVTGSTGAALITTVDGGTNSILVVPGANASLVPEDIDREWERLRVAAFVLAQLEIPLDTVEHLAMRCAEAGIPFILDPAPVRTLGSGLLKATTWLTPNETETRALTGIDVSSAQEAELRSVAEDLLGMGVAGVVLKLGARGAYIANRAMQRWIPPFAVVATDTTAAGDAFNGAFAASLLRHGDASIAAHFACAAAALSTTRPGAIPSLPSRAEVDQLLTSCAPGRELTLADYS